MTARAVFRLLYALLLAADIPVKDGEAVGGILLLLFMIVSQFQGKPAAPAD